MGRIKFVSFHGSPIIGNNKASLVVGMAVLLALQKLQLSST